MYPASYCPCESSSSSVHGVVLKYGFKHEMIQFTFSKIEWLGCLLLDVFFLFLYQFVSLMCQIAMVSACVKMGDSIFALKLFE